MFGVGLLEPHLSVLDRKMKAWRERKSPVWGLPTGIASLDRLLGGLQDEDLVLLAGRPSMGKTSAALQIGTNIARYFAAQVERGETDRPSTVVIFEAETDGWSLLLREMARQTGVSSRQIKSGDYSEEEAALLAQARTELASLPLYIDSTPNIPTKRVHEQLSYLKAQQEMRIGIVIYDYVQKADDQAPSDYVRVSIAARNLKIVARTYGVPVLALSQISREVERREDHTPMLSDLKESGKLEDDADTVIFIHRPAYYKRAAARDGSEEEVQLIVPKNRNGETGEISLFFNPQFTEFRDPDAKTDPRRLLF